MFDQDLDGLYSKVCKQDLARKPCIFTHLATLSLADHVHEFNPNQNAFGRMERFETESPFDDALDYAMILLYELHFRLSLRPRELFIDGSHPLHIIGE